MLSRDICVTTAIMKIKGRISTIFKITESLEGKKAGEDILGERQ